MLKKKKRTKNQERLQHEQVKDVSDLPEVGQTNDIPIYGHNEQEDQVNSQPNKRKNESLTMKLKAAKQHQIHKKIIIKKMFRRIQNRKSIITTTGKFYFRSRRSG